MAMNASEFNLLPWIQLTFCQKCHDIFETPTEGAEQSGIFPETFGLHIGMNDNQKRGHFQLSFSKLNKIYVDAMGSFP